MLSDRNFIFPFCRCRWNRGKKCEVGIQYYYECQKAVDYRNYRTLITMSYSPLVTATVEPVGEPALPLIVLLPRFIQPGVAYCGVGCAARETCMPPLA